MASDGASSISVTVRVRPFTIREAAQLTRNDDGPLFLGEGSLAGAPTPKLLQKGLRPIVKVVDDRCLIFDPPEDSPVQRFSKGLMPQHRRFKDQTFAFDKVFDENTTQGEVYEATSKGLLDSVLDGYNATVFAYGATGCGKTHTITGTVQQPGIIFLTLQELFEKISERQEDKVTELSLSYLEIYNETIQDLLEPGGSKQGLSLREDANHTVSVAGLSSHTPKNVQEVMDIIVKGNECRTMSPTEANATSSRSHAVLQINISQKDRNAAVNEPHTMATLSIIDLAGSERASATKNRGDRLMEGANINKSLLSLGSCINALCDPRKKNHVPYRNSKLTRLLKFSLGGNCRTVMIVCVSPSSSHYDETQNTLRYANRAKNIQTKVTRNVFNVNRHVKDFLKKIDEQMHMINELKAQQKDYENVAFGKFKKQMEKKDVVLKEGILRLRNAYDHCSADRLERVNNMKKLRQIEKRIAMISAWLAAFDGVCENREDEDPPKNLLAMRKTAQGVLVELEGSRNHYHQRISKGNWTRAIETALQNATKQMQEIEAGVEPSDLAVLEREAEILKANADSELHAAIQEQERASDGSMMHLLLRAHFETVANINRLLSMDEGQAIQHAKSILNKLLTSSSDATSQVIRPDGSVLAFEALPRTKSGTPKRQKLSTLMIPPSPAQPRLVIPGPEISRLNLSPVKASPRRIRIGSAKKGVTLTPRKRIPMKRAVRWRDDTEDGKLADFEKTPQQIQTSPDDSSVEIAPPLPSLPLAVAPKNIELSSSPIPGPPQTSMDMRPKSDRFQNGFLSRRINGSPAPSNMNFMSSSPEPSPLQEMTNNRASGRASTEFDSRETTGSQIESGTQSSSDSDKGSKTSDENSEAKQISQAVRRASLARRNSIRDSHRRRSPSASTTTGSPPSEGLFTASHARRMVKGESEWRHSVLSPRSTPITKQATGHRRTTMSVDHGFSRANSLGSNGRLSNLSNGGANRGSFTATGMKNFWR